MALSQAVMQPSGVSALYWRIEGCQHYYRDGCADVKVCGYVTAAAAAAAPLNAYPVVPAAGSAAPPATPVVLPMATRIIRIPFSQVPIAPVVDYRAPLYVALMASLEATDPLYGAVSA